MLFRRLQLHLSVMQSRVFWATSLRETATKERRQSYSILLISKGETNISCSKPEAVDKYWLTTWYRREHKSCEFELHEAYAIDIIVSTGEGKVGCCTYCYGKSFCVSVVGRVDMDLELCCLTEYTVSSFLCRRSNKMPEQPSTGRQTKDTNSKWKHPEVIKFSTFPHLS